MSSSGSRELRAGPRPAAALAGAAGRGHRGHRRASFSALLQSAGAAAPLAAPPRPFPPARAAPACWRPCSARSASPSSRRAPTTRRGSPSTARRPRAAASARGVRTSRRGRRARRACRSARAARASARVDALYAWAQRAGRAVPNGPGVVPRPGDLIVWDEHIGVVESVAARRLGADDRGQLVRSGLATHAPGRQRARLRADGVSRAARAACGRNGWWALEERCSAIAQRSVESARPTRLGRSRRRGGGCPCHGSGRRHVRDHAAHRRARARRRAARVLYEAHPFVGTAHSDNSDAKKS